MLARTHGQPASPRAIERMQVLLPLQNQLEELKAVPGEIWWGPRAVLAHAVAIEIDWKRLGMILLQNNLVMKYTTRFPTRLALRHPLT